ncbi:hypothetical protein ABZ957_21830 [Streptomyces sp. NPDC046316]|uniref:hypothetical protein n=1 Tax=Streptomyces sp. NPDC046316 TaxID=3154494 RepID=UPI003409F8E8
MTATTDHGEPQGAGPAWRCLDITAAEAETLTSGWSLVRTADLDVLRLSALRP